MLRGFSQLAVGVLGVAYCSIGCGSESEGAGTDAASSGNGGGASEAASASGGQASTSGGATTSTSGGASTGGGGASAPGEVYGEVVEGQYHLGPVDFAESEWHNACAPAGGYRAQLREATGLMGEYLAGVSSELSQSGGVCDACIAITTKTGRSLVARVVTYGVSNAPGDLDVSPAVYNALNTGEYPRSMSWQFARCPDVGTIVYEFQTEANPYWTSLWVRNPRVPLSKVEVKSANHADYFALRRETDGTLNDDGGFGNGEFTFRLTALDGQVIEETLPGFSAGEVIASKRQFE